jgi:glycine/D-amino acid oxidase-like deaminating enzyme
MKTAVIVGAGVFGVGAARYSYPLNLTLKKIDAMINLFIFIQSRELAQRGWSIIIVDPSLSTGPNSLASTTDISKLVRSDYGKYITHLEYHLLSPRKFYSLI